MGNVFSFCCPKNPCESQGEDQRLLHESIPSPQTSANVLEEGPVSTDCTTPESSETPSPAEPAPGEEQVLDQAAVQVETDVLATQVKPDASAVGNNVHMYAGSAVDNSTLVDQQEEPAGVVMQVLADATKIVNAPGEGGVITSFASQTLDVSSRGDVPLDALQEKAESQAASMEKLEGASTMTNSQAAVTGLESQSASTPVKSPTISFDEVECLGTSTVSDSQAAEESGSTTMESQAVPSEKLESQETSTRIENHAAAAVSENQAATENLESHISATVIDSQATSTITDYQAVSAKIVPETPGSSVDMEAQDSLVKIIETTPAKTPENEEVFGELQQVPAVPLNGSLAEAVLVREKAEDVIPPQEPLSTIKPAVTEANPLNQNSSAKENELNESLNEPPNGLSPSPETHVQFGLLAPQDEPSEARDGELEEDQEVTSAVPDIEDKLAEGVRPHSSDGGRGVSMEGPFPESELSSALTDTSASVQDSEEKKGTDVDSKLKEEPCNGEDISVTSEKEVNTEMRGSAADSDTQDVVGLTTVSSLEDMLEDKWMTNHDDHVETNSAVSGIEDGGLATSPQDERPGSGGQLSPVESDGIEINCEEDIYRGEEEIKEDQEKNKLVEMTVPGLGPPMAILTYSEREWKGQTTKSAVIRKGYTVLSQSFGCLRRVRGDNYCALRATLYQALMNSAQLPDWLQQESFLLIPEELEARYGLIKGWRFPDVCKQINGTENAVDLLKHYLGLFQKWWHEAVTSCGPDGNMRVCDELFQGGMDEFGLMEALKLLMLACAVELHTAMQSGDDVPIFCWLLFARDTSSCPRTLVANHLSQVGFSGGLEQVEMFLLGYALRHTIKVYRLYMADTEEFITHYPDDHIQDWPCLCLVTEDDRHYNVVVGDPAHPQEDPSAGLQ